MPDEKPPDDPLTQQLRESLRRQRPWTLAILILLVLLLLAPVGLFLWLLRPAAEPPRLGIVAADILTVPGEDVHLRAYLETVSDVEFAAWKGHQVFFEEAQHLDAPARRPPVPTHSAADGAASVPWSFPAQTTQADFLARFVDRRRRYNADDRARVFLKPAATPLLLVDLRTLSPAAVQTWAQVLEIPLHPEAAAALQAVQARQYQVVYLAGDADRPRRYRLARAWLDHRFASKPSLPLGPVLWYPVGMDKETSLWAKVLVELRQHFTGPMVAVAGSPDAAAACLARGLPTLWLGPDAVPPGARKIAFWAEVIKELPPA